MHIEVIQRGVGLGAARYAMVVDGDAYARTMTGFVLRELGFEVEHASDAAAAMALLNDWDADIAVLEIELRDGPSGFEVLRLLQQRFPWTAALILTNYRSPRLVDHDIPPLAGVPFLIKSEIRSPQQLADGVAAALDRVSSPRTSDTAACSITPGQADVLRMIARGYSNQRVAAELGISGRAAQHATRRLYRALGIDDDHNTNSRVTAARMYREAAILVRGTPIFGAPSMSPSGPRNVRLAARSGRQSEPKTASRRTSTRPSL